MCVIGISLASVGGCSFDRLDALASTYPDLEEKDVKLVDRYLGAYENRKSQPERYQQARGEVLTRMRQLQIELEAAAGDAPRQLRTLARLVNFNRIMRETGVAPANFARRSFCEMTASLRQCTGEALAADIPEEVKLALEVDFRALNFLDYVALHVRRAFFVERIREHILILDSNLWVGASEGATRSVVIAKNFEPWMLAAALVHEAAHIDRFYRFADNAKMQELDRVERYAYIVLSAYLSNLILKVDGDKSVPEATKQKIASAFAVVLSRIAAINQRLGFDPKDYDAAK